jgi:glycosyltransferase involved in cell wall biosynthesis
MIAADFPRVVLLEGARLNLGANRNCALDAVTGTYVAFIDDDTTLRTDLLSQIAESLQHDGRYPGKFITKFYELN